MEDSNPTRCSTEEVPQTMGHPHLFRPDQQGWATRQPQLFSPDQQGWATRLSAASGAAFAVVILGQIAAAFGIARTQRKWVVILQPADCARWPAATLLHQRPEVSCDSAVN